jgi:hypothetical protein
MANDPLAMSHLRALLSQREALYRQADHIIDTSDIPVGDIVERIVEAIDSGGPGEAGSAHAR